VEEDTGEPIDDVDIGIDYPDKECDLEAGCRIGTNGECRCKGSVFEAVDQIEEIFSNSDLLNADWRNLKNYRFLESSGFWAIISISLGFLIASYVVKKKIPNFCVMEKLEK